MNGKQEATEQTDKLCSLCLLLFKPGMSCAFCVSVSSRGSAWLRRFLHPCRGADAHMDGYRGWQPAARALPPANFRHPLGMVWNEARASGEQPCLRILELALMAEWSWSLRICVHLRSSAVNVQFIQLLLRGASSRGSVSAERCDGAGKDDSGQSMADPYGPSDSGRIRARPRGLR